MITRWLVQAAVQRHGHETTTYLSRATIDRMTARGLTTFNPLVLYYAVPGPTENTVRFVHEMADTLVLFSPSDGDGDAKLS